MSLSISPNHREVLSAVSTITSSPEYLKSTSGSLNVLLTAGSATIGSITGTKTNNNAAPGATNVGVLSAIANAAAPTWTEANLVAASSDLSGNIRQTLGTALDSTNDSITASNTTGNVASGATDSGNPVKIGAVVASSATNFSNGQRGNLQMSPAGELIVRLRNGNGSDPVMASPADALSNGNNTLYVASLTEVFNGASWDRQRTPTTFNSAQATASGDTAVWTPTSGKKFRIMRFKIQVSENAVITSGGVVTIKLRDSTTDLNLTHDVFVPGAATTTLVGDYDSGWIDLGNGKLSAVANNVLNANLSNTLTTGNVRVIVAGVEE